MSCTNKQGYEQPYSFEDILMLSTQQWEMNSDQEEYENFRNDWILFNNLNSSDEKDACYKLGSNTEQMILVQNSNGTIQYVIPENKNDKTECFVKIYLGKKYPKPPFSPFYHLMEKRGE